MIQTQKCKYNNPENIGEYLGNLGEKVCESLPHATAAETEA